MTATATAQDTDALAALARFGAHLVLARPDKTPLWTQWNERKPGPPTVRDHVEKHGGAVGIRPLSLDCAVVDVDRGDPRQLWHRFPPHLACDSRSRENAHGWYSDLERRKDGTFEAFGCGGDIKASGYVLLYGDAPERVYGGLVGVLKRDIPPLPIADLFAHVGIELEDAVRPAPAAVERPAPAPPRPSQSYDGRPLEAVEVGSRNTALFHTVRHRAYLLPVTDGAGLDDRVAEIALRENRRFPEPLPEAEVLEMAWRVSSWVANRGNHLRHPYYDHSPEAQRRRGVKRWHGDATARTFELLDWRDALILDLAEDGWRQTDIAAHAQVMLSRRRVGQILAGLRRDQVVEPPEWEAEGISRRTWYRRGGRRRAEQGGLRPRVA